MISNSKELVIFDLDGTLIDSSKTVANAINFVRDRIGLPPMDKKKILEAVNNPNLNPAEYFYDLEKFEPIHQEWFMEYYSNHHNQELRLFDGVLELLDKLKSRGCKLALATNAYRRSTLEALEYLGIDKIFDIVVCYDDVKRAKPYPDMLLYICNRLNIPKHRAIFIGDGNKDKESSISAGIDFILVSWGYSTNIEDDSIEDINTLEIKLDSICFSNSKEDKLNSKV